MFTFFAVMSRGVTIWIIQQKDILLKVSETFYFNQKSIIYTTYLKVLSLLFLKL